MKKRDLSILPFIILVTYFSFLISCSTSENSADSIKTPKNQEAKARKFSFEYTADFKDFPTNGEKTNIWLPIPHNNEYQKIESLTIDSPFSYRVTQGKHGNKYAYFDIGSTNTKDFSIKMKFDVERKEHINLLVAGYAKDNKKINLDKMRLKHWLEPDRLVPTDGKIREWAEEVISEANADTDLEKARAIYNHIIKTVKYDKSGKGWGRGDIYYACDERRGNCTDFHAIFIGYTRAVGIPARFAIGFPLPPERGSAEIKGYHCWAEFYVEGYGWIPIDASEAAKNPDKREYFFGAHDENRVEFTIGRDLIMDPKQQGEPLNYFIYPYVEIDGKEYKEYEKTFNVKDIE